MQFRDLREYINTLREKNEIRVLEGVSCNLEIGAITELATNLENRPAILFDAIEGFPRGYRVMTNIVSNRMRERLVFGVSQDFSDKEAVHFWKDKLKKYKAGGALLD